MNWIERLIEAFVSLFDIKAPPGVPERPVEVPVATPTYVLPPPPPENQNLKMYRVAMEAIGSDVSPKENELACAESLSNLLHKAYGDFPAEILGTAQLNSLLATHPKFKATLTPGPGVVIMSPTVGTNHGHCGCFGDGENIMSNSSFTYKWGQNYTLANWVKYFRTQKGLRVLFYERI